MSTSETRFVFWDGVSNLTADGKIDPAASCKFTLLANAVEDQRAAPMPVASIVMSGGPMKLVVEKPPRVRIKEMDEAFVPLAQLLAIKLRLRMVGKAPGMLVRVYDGDDVVYQEVFTEGEIRRMPVADPRPGADKKAPLANAKQDQSRAKKRAAEALKSRKYSVRAWMAKDVAVFANCDGKKPAADLDKLDGVMHSKSNTANLDAKKFEEKHGDKLGRNQTQVREADYKLTMHLDADRDGVVDAQPADLAEWTWGAQGKGAILMPSTAEGGESTRLEVQFRFGANEALAEEQWQATLTFDQPLRARAFAAKSGGQALAHPVDLKALASENKVRRVWLEAADFPAEAEEASARVKATFRFQPPGNKPAQTQVAALRIAPWIMACDLDKTEVVFARGGKGNAAPSEMTQALVAAIGNTAQVSPLAVAPTAVDKGFMRDAMRSGYAQSAAGAQVVIQENLDESPLAHVVSTYRAKVKDAGVIRRPPNVSPKQLLGQDNGGNLLVSPPRPGFPFGRIILGDDGEKRCKAAPFYAAQMVQAPIAVDSIWLDVGHVDEILSFVPDYSQGATTGFKVLIASPRLAYLLMWLTGRQMHEPAGDGARSDVAVHHATGESRQLMKRPEFYDDLRGRLRQDTRFASMKSTVADGAPEVPPPFTIFNGLDANPPAPRGADGKLVCRGYAGTIGDKLKRLWPDVKVSAFKTVDPKAPNAVKPLSFPKQEAQLELRKDAVRHLADADATWRWMVDEIQPRLDEARDQLKSELGLSDDDFIEVPVILAKTEDGRAFFETPDAINMLILNDPAAKQCTCIVPKPFGPVIDDRYLFEEYLRAQLEPLRLTLKIINDLPLSRLHGEIHCGTNQVHKSPAARWWHAAPVQAAPWVKPARKAPPNPSAPPPPAAAAKIAPAKPPPSQDDEDLKLGENYLSADYRRINPMLGAFEAHKYAWADVRSANFDPSAKAGAIVEDWKKIAIARKNANSQDVEGWDEQYLSATLDLFKRINRVWNKFAVPAATVVYRGDAAFLFESYPFLDPKKSGYPDGERPLDRTIEFPGIMSTTVADPKSHNFVSDKTVVWDIKLPQGHQGRCLGNNNPSEAEVTFPVGTRLRIEKILVRVNDKTQAAEKYGAKAMVIVFAQML